MKYSTVLLLLLSWPLQMSHDAPADAGLLCNKAAMLSAAIKVSVAYAEQRGNN
jgi:hypothetical protein